MSLAYYSDNDGKVYYIDDNGQSQYLDDGAGNTVSDADGAPSSPAPESDGGRSDSPRRSTHSGSSRHSKGSKSSRASKSDSGQSSNTPATIGWQCYWCQEINYTDHQNIPFMDPLLDANGNIRKDEDGKIIFPTFPDIPCVGCNESCDPYCTPIIDP
ncbi:hypothetical protein F5Y19DRAFT_474474 [Xylariaceae sp. FL1651]|nr:hypothetical protein F5Y19DRAFT_474474 [Xylariaceae sp. FL1651]